MFFQRYNCKLQQLPEPELKQYFYSELQRMRMSKQIIFQQDGVPAHYGSDDDLNDKFSGKWIGRRGAIKWAPMSPDFNTMRFFLMGLFKA